jgi:hypothetical protein
MEQELETNIMTQGEKPKTNCDTNNDKLSKYQRIHLCLIAVTVIFSMITAIMFIRQVMNLTEQTKRNTEVLGLQKRAVEGQTWQLIIQQMNQIDKIFIDNPDLYPYFFQKKQLKSNDKNYPKVKSMAVMLLDFMDAFDDDYVRKLAGMNDGGKYWISWENYFVDQFSLSPVLCDSYKEMKSWYVENGVITKFAAKGCGQIKQKK